jgi:hypothetical protein
MQPIEAVLASGVEMLFRSVACVQDTAWSENSLDLLERLG